MATEAAPKAFAPREVHGRPSSERTAFLKARYLEAPLVVDVEADVPGRVCRVSVSDSGDGIPQQILDRIFEPFATSKEHGTGLGLAVSHRIAKEHGGVLLAANQTEGGAAFTLELPLSTEDTHGEAISD